MNNEDFEVRVSEGNLPKVIYNLIKTDFHTIVIQDDRGGSGDFLLSVGLNELRQSN